MNVVLVEGVVVEEAVGKLVCKLVVVVEAVVEDGILVVVVVDMVLLVVAML